MPLLASPGIFAMLVPDGWEVTTSKDTLYELTRSDELGALHISVYERPPDSELAEREAEDGVVRFIDRLNPTDQTEVRVLAEGPDQYRAVAWCTAADPTGGLYSWLVFLVLWKSWVLMCTCTAPFGSTMPAEAEQMFATIHPDSG
jgi:hypothetical protein